ncbi:hypothetical protein [Mycoplasma suis]|uniref:Uncharacterized protein n=1 Tax=Mycoplasma suis (strain Illinois) TaxID=768700 RepID=F0QRB4_MYCSL|nr:hypothetical protein [Mycoplasma suis]ADX98034.1 hypothetical protein MSU_0499 [Mycoplasma suis str. Illinois]
MIPVPKGLESVFVLNFSNFKHSYERPLEFSFLNSVELQNVVEKDDSKDKNMSFLGIAFTQNEWKWNIMKKINKNIESMLYDAFLDKLMEILHLKIEDIYFFQGDQEQWEIFMKEIEKKEVALIYNPRIQLLNIRNIQLPIILSPGALLFHKNKFSCFLFSESLRPGNIFFAEFTFYHYWLTKYLSVDIQDLAIFWKPIKEEKDSATFSFTLPKVKTLSKSSPNKRISIHQAMGVPLPDYKDSWFSRFLSREEYSQKFETSSQLTELEIEKITQSCELLSEEIIKRMMEIQSIALKLIEKITEEYTPSEWFKKVNWREVIELTSLSENKKLTERFSFLLQILPLIELLFLLYFLTTLS